MDKLKEYESSKSKQLPAEPKSLTTMRSQNQTMPQALKALLGGPSPTIERRSSNMYASPRNIFSKILDEAITEQQRKNNPQLIRIKNNILMLLFVLTAYGVYYLIGDFINILLTAFIAGIAYQQTRQRFASFIMHQKSYKGNEQRFTTRLIKCVLLAIFGFTLPRLRYLLANPKKIWQIRAIPSFDDFLLSLKMNTNWVVFCCEGIILFWIVYLLLGPHLKKVGNKLRPTNKTCVNFVFLLISFVVILLSIIIIPSVLFREISSVGSLVQNKVEQKLGCQIISIQDNDNSTLPYCSDMLTSQNEFIRQTISQFRDQNQTIQKCATFVKKIQKDYIGQQIFMYDQIACTWFTFIQKASNYSGIASTASAGDLVMTGTNVFKTFFGNLASILSAFSDFIFSATTFFTMFYLTTQFFNPGITFQEIFSEQKQQLVSSITNLIQATSLIVLEHFVVSVFLLEIFNFTNINLLIATLLSSMALFPYIRPWSGMLVIALIRIIITDETYVSLLFVALYYYISEKIYSFHLQKMEFHEIVTNMSVLFGIYRFGIAGIFYGPLIIITYKCVERQLMN